MSDGDSDMQISDNDKPEQDESPISESWGVNSAYMSGAEDDEDLLDGDAGSDDEVNAELKTSENSQSANDGVCNGQPDGLTKYQNRRILLNQAPTSSLGPLPEGWIMTAHSCGFPVYFHRATRVVTWSRPYILTNGRLKKHDIPIESIPCYNFVKQSSQEENKERPNSDENGKQNANDEQTIVDQDEGSNPAAHPKVTIHDSRPQYIDNDDFITYLEKRFQFETRLIPQFQKWKQRREFNKSLKRKRTEETYNTGKDVENGDELKGSVANLITLTVEQDDGGTTTKKKFVLNTTSKPMVCVLHEYAQRVLKCQPQYLFDTREDCTEPFEATIKLEGKVYGKATAINKKSAKNKAALATLEMLIPGFKGQVESKGGQPDMKCFNDVLVSDPRVHELCVHTGQLLPYQLLTECLKRHQGVANTNISYDVQQGKRRTLNYTMMCGKYLVSGQAKNKKLGKQLAAQKILQQIHPEVETWMELIEKYGTPMAHERAKRKQEEQEIFDLKQRRNYADEEDAKPSSSASSDRSALEPNPELLAKLREMMFKLREQQEKRKAKAAEDARTGRVRPTPMAAAIAADRGLITSSESAGCSRSDATERESGEISS